MVLDLQLSTGNPRELVFDVSGSQLQIDRLRHGHRRSAFAADWWAGLELDDALLHLSAPVALEGRVIAAMRDTVPLIEAFAPEQQVDLLTALLDKSLVEMDASGEQRTGRSRYRLLETVRQYARERLQEEEETGAVRTRHRDHFLALAEAAGPEIAAGDRGDGFARLDAEHDLEASEASS